MTESARATSKRRVTPVKSAVFHDGMVVTAGDLDAAMQYPLQMFQILARAYFGCGVVCGLRLTEEAEGSKTMCAVVQPGVALDCEGLPVQLCELVKFDFSAENCEPPEEPKTVCIALKRCTVPEDPRGDEDDCESSSSTTCQPGRQREGVVLRVFDVDKLPKELCSWRDADERPTPSNDSHDGCACQRECKPHHCCGPAWILIGCVTYDKDGIQEIDEHDKKYVKPIDCHCASHAKPVQPEPEPVPADEQ